MSTRDALAFIERALRCTALDKDYHETFTVAQESPTTLVIEKEADEAALKAMKEGVKDKSDKQTMKPAENVSEEEMKALVAHVRALKK